MNRWQAEYIARLDVDAGRFALAVWWNRQIGVPVSGRTVRRRVLSDATVRRWGYDILTAPLPLGRTANPFDEGCEGATEYCARCGDCLPTENLCAHVWYCEICGVYSTPQDRCKHRRPRYTRA